MIFNGSPVPGFTSSTLILRNLPSRSAFEGLFKNRWLWAAVGFSLALHAAVIYVPFLQQAFSTAALSLGDWMYCATVASSVLWLRELSKVVTRARER